MSANRLIKVFVVLALALVVLLSVREVASSAEVINASRAYDRIEALRTARSESILPGDRAYDVIEAQRLASGFANAKQRYEGVEILRVAHLLNSNLSTDNYDAVERLRASRKY